MLRFCYQQVVLFSHVAGRSLGALPPWERAGLSLGFAMAIILLL